MMTLRCGFAQSLQSAHVRSAAVCADQAETLRAESIDLFE
jgi:hypothetical protein